MRVQTLSIENKLKAFKKRHIIIALHILSIMKKLEIIRRHGQPLSEIEDYFRIRVDSLFSILTQNYGIIHRFEALEDTSKEINKESIIDRAEHLTNELTENKEIDKNVKVVIEELQKGINSLIEKHNQYYSQLGRL